MLKRIAIDALVVYLMVGLTLGGFMRTSIPAMNGLGVLYYGTTWPGFVLHGLFGLHTNPPIPAWAFTFKEQLK